jgi:hypothetical protein
MATPVESANLILKLYEQRREEVMRKARDFMVTFDPKTFEELVAGYTGPNGSYIRMVVSYWEMAASLVLNGAIDSKMFQEANGEYILVFSRVEPFLPQLRQMMQNPLYLKSLEQFTLSIPDAKNRIETIRQFIRQMMAMRAAASEA